MGPDYLDGDEFESTAMPRKKARFAGDGEFLKSFEKLMAAIIGQNKQRSLYSIKATPLM